MDRFWSLITLATFLIVIISWLSLLMAMSAALIAWTFWPYVALPLFLWMVLLALPALYLGHKGVLNILKALVTTAKAWLA